MTDILRGIVGANAAEVMARVRNDLTLRDANIARFIAEMQDIGANDRTLFVLFGRDTTELFNDYLARAFPNSVGLVHYSDCHWTWSGWVQTAEDALMAYAVSEEGQRYGTPQFVRRQMPA